MSLIKHFYAWLIINKSITIMIGRLSITKSINNEQLWSNASFGNVITLS